jgi:3-phosphoglycerate kinase
MDMKTNWKEYGIADYSSLKGKRVIVRLDLNLPVSDGKLTDTSRADVVLPFLKQLSFAGAKMVLMSHFGEKGESLEPVARYMHEHLPFISFYPSRDLGEIETRTKEISEGDAILLENVRLWKGEEEDLPSLGRAFAALGDVYINNAFSVSHRKHASVVGIPKTLLSYFGPTFMRELEHLAPALAPAKPALMIIGGAKIKTKLSLIERYLDQGVRVFVGGAMVHDIWKARGVRIGESFSDETVSLSERFFNHPLLVLPLDVVLANGEAVPFYSIPSDGMIVDCGPDTVALLKKEIASARTVIMNGPLGLYEKGWLHGTEQALTTLAHADATSYIGGGDTVAVAHSLHLLRHFDFVSLGGGAMLDFLANATLPGIHAVTESKTAGYR